MLFEFIRIAENKYGKHCTNFTLLFSIRVTRAKGCELWICVKQVAREVIGRKPKALKSWFG